MARRIKPGGVAEYFNEFGFSGPVKEMHSSTCAHCQKGTDFPSMRKMMEYVEICRNCMRLICLDCYGKPCRPYEKEVERQEAEAEIKNRLMKDGWKCY